MDPHYVPPADAILSAIEVAQWLKLVNRHGVPQPRQVQRLGVPCIRLGHKTIRYKAATVAEWLEQQVKAA
jgi:hypothetical protein